MKNDISINQSTFSEEFKGVDSEGVFLLARDNAQEVWQRYIDEKAPSYFKLADDNWLIRSRQTVFGHWLTAFNGNDTERIESILDSSISWDNDYVIYFCISKYFILTSKWRLFKKLWINFLECEDDCPVLVNSRNEGQAIIFSPIGNITKFQIK